MHDPGLGPSTRAIARLFEQLALRTGQAALARYRGEDWQRWLLWGVLAVGALLVLVVSVKVLKAGPKPG